MEQQFYKDLEKEIDFLLSITETDNGQDLSDLLPSNFTDNIINIIKDSINKYVDKYGR